VYGMSKMDIELTDEMAVTKATPKPSISATQRMISVLGIFAMAWYLMNLMAFVTVTLAPLDYILERYTQEQIDYLASLPTWSLMISGLAIGFGLVASLALFLRKVEAYPAFMLSLLMAIAHLFDTVSRGGIRIMSAGEAAASIMVMFFALFLFWATYEAKNQNQLR